MTIQITVNGGPQEVPAGHTIAALVQELDLAEKRVAIEINEQIVPRSTYPQRVLRPGDRVEVVTAIGGG